MDKSAKLNETEGIRAREKIVVYKTHTTHL